METIQDGFFSKAFDLFPAPNTLNSTEMKTVHATL